MLFRSERLRAAEGLTQEIAAHAGCREARLVWRVMGREALREHHRKTDRDGSSVGGLLYVYSHECVRRAEPGRYGGSAAWPTECPWQALPSTHEAHRAWPALRALAAIGLHLVALDASRIVLAVEAIGGDRG